MGNGYLKRYFRGAAVKRLAEVEVNPLISHQHEYNANKDLIRLFGKEVPRQTFPAVFLYLDDEKMIQASGALTWYDARFNHPKRTEWRMYFPTTEVMSEAATGDSLFICKKQDGTVLSIVARQGSTVENQLYWLFDFDNGDYDNFVVKTEFDSQRRQIEIVSRTILEQIEIEYQEEYENDYLGQMRERFSDQFPSTKEFSQYARSTVQDVDPLGNPDDALVKWLNQEEILFKQMEEYLIRERLKQGFVDGDKVNVDAFIRFSLSVHNRRKSRAGLSLENHVEELLNCHNISYVHTPTTENKSKPDFLFPSIEIYRDVNYPVEYLTMLGVKSSCKDRWRQVLAEADRISRKCLLTLEAAISENQTNEMTYKNIQLIVPESIHGTYTDHQRKRLWKVRDLLEELKEKQEFYKSYQKDQEI